MNARPPPTLSTPRPAVVTVGDELLYGERENGNQRWLLSRLQTLGHPAELALSLPDDLGAIAHWIAALVARGCAPILVSGGIGGTHDDCTRQGVAAGLGLRLELHPECDAILAERYGERYTPQRRRMAELPAGCSLLPNVGGAPGFRSGDVFGFPGFPEMLQPMAEAVLAEVLPRNDVETVSIEATLAVMEGDIALDVEAFSRDHPGARIGIYPVSGGGPPAVTLRLRLPADDAATRSAFDTLVANLRVRCAG
jgi:molybdopterin-biosynthesis enzyme MoeA-like protein